MENNDFYQYLEDKNISIKEYNIYLDAISDELFKKENNINPYYEHLNFLGESVLYFITTDIIYIYCEEWNPEKMAKLRSDIINTKNLAQYVKDDKINDYLLFGESSNKNQLINSDEYLANIFKSLIGAMWLDTNIKTVKHFIKSFIIKKIKEVANDEI